MSLLSLSPAVRALHGAGISAADLARDLGISERTVQHWLRGDTRPRPALWDAIAQRGGPALAKRVRRLVPGEAVR
ncbi:helix-turn-helix domain-containing protein [Egicoccus halophilus]|uniref:HTH cro/C1-type domain-containing protein n=1 Tax=Egicoccus halophilus TaxID=1670830 RepID=A0A8J3ABA0_9ACTN|nr:hypothetical protein GCM10011354_23060 [Egicoccus halophilus]